MRYYIDEKGMQKATPEVNPNHIKPNDFGVDEKVSVFEQLFLSIGKAKALPGLAALKSSKFVGYLLLILTMMSFLVTVIPATAAIAQFGGFEKLFGQTLPAFTVQDGELVTDEDFEMNVQGVHILLKHDVDSVSKEDLNGISGVYYTFGKKQVKMIVYQKQNTDDFYNEVYVLPVSTMFPDGFNNQSLIDYIWAWYLGIFFGFIWRIITLAGRYLLLSLILMLVFNGLMEKTTLEMNGSDLFKMAFYAQTIGINIVNINQAFGYLLPASLLSIVGMFVAVYKMRKALMPYLREINSDDEERRNLFR